MRKLARVCIALSFSVFLSYYLLPVGILPWLTPGALLLGLLTRHRSRKLFLLLLGAGIGFGAFWLHWNLTVLPATQWDDSERTFSALVLEYPQEYEHYSRIRVQTESWPRLGIYLYDYNDVTGTLIPGDRVLLSAKVKRADLRNGERNDSYVSKDVYLTGTLRTVDVVLGRRQNLRTAAAICSRRISDYAKTLFSEETQAFMRSLMLGDKTDFYQDLPMYADMRGAGFMHIVAVSGMHIAFLVGMMQLLLGARPLSSIMGLLLVWFFVFMTGASPSAVRAGTMQTILLFAPIVRRENDGPTTLSAALALILLANPFSCASISLQLSFSAMAGMTLLAEPLTAMLMKAFRQRDNSPLRGLTASVGASLAVMACSTPFSVLHFGTLAIFSPLTNLLGLWAVSLCFCGGYLSCLLSFVFPPLGRLLIIPTEWLARYLLTLAAWICRLPHHLIGMRNPPMMLWMGLCYALGLFAWRSRAKAAQRVFLPAFLCLLTLAAALFSAEQRYRNGAAVITALDVGQGECVCVLSGDSTVMLDCGGIGTAANAGETAAIWLESACRDHIDLLLLSHLHEDHVNGVPMLLELMPVREILLSPDSDTDEGLLRSIMESAERHGTTVTELRQDEIRQEGQLRLRLFAPPEEGTENERCIISLVSIGDFDMLYTGDSPKTAENELIENNELPDTELLIVGHHGSRTSSDPSFLESIRPETAIISVGRNNSFGHPTWEVLERLRSCGCRICRTDLQGNIEVRVGSA
ncbi:MAG: DNA internalization-related competence protein ComEC/Rec2 [Oscillospiraceae bacterium]|nr:DNA internalization-related competence protein ComEC/Rec2 [Oscillospiraceae bacterium]